MKSNNLFSFSAAIILMLGCAACTAQPEAPVAEDNTSPGPDTTFFQEASWSPDGTKLLLSRLDIHDAYRSSIVVINVDGSGYERLTEGPADMWASWSPDGTQIVYGSKEGDNREIYRMNTVGSDPIRLTSDPGEDTHPHWSPDGARIVFVSDRGGQSQIYTMKADGSEQTQIGQGPETKWNPRWSPDGRRIAYYGTVEPGKDSVYVMNADGTGKRALAAGVWPAWSPDGSRILFVSEKKLFEIGAEGGAPREIMADVIIARWSPDGSRIAFVRTTWRAESGWPSTSDVFIADIDGSSVKRITHRYRTVSSSGP